VDMYVDLAKHCKQFDFSVYPTNHTLFGKQNKMTNGKMKDEAASLIITEFVGLRPNMYSYTTMNTRHTVRKEAKRAKGIQSAVMVDVRHAYYLSQLHVAQENYINIRRIDQKHHRIFTTENMKRGLCDFNDKRYLLHDGIHTLAHGHYAIREEQVREDECSRTIIQQTEIQLNDEIEPPGHIAMSYRQAEGQGLTPWITDDRAITMVAGTDLRQSIRVINATDSTVHRNHHIAENENEDDDDLIAAKAECMENVVDVAMSVALNDEY